MEASVAPASKAYSSPAQQARLAQEELGRELRKLFGPKLQGVNAFGAGLDHETRRMSLRVTVDTPLLAQRAAAKLPDTIEGLPVYVWQGEAAKAE
jgi:hypothetical protein